MNIIRKITRKLGSTKFFTRILIMYFVIFINIIIGFTQYVSSTSLKLLMKSQESISIQELTSLQNIMTQKNNTVREMIFKIYDDLDMYNYVSDVLGSGSKDFVPDTTYETKNLIKKFDSLISLDKDVMSLMLFDNDYKRAYLYQKGSKLFAANDELINWLPKSKGDTSFIVTSLDKQLNKGNTSENSFGIICSLIYTNTSYFAGKIGFILSTNSFDKVFTENENTFKGNVLILTKDGSVVYDSSQQYYGKKYPYLDLVQRYDKSVKLDTESLVNVINIENDKYLYVATIPKYLLYKESNMFKNSTYVLAIVLLFTVFGIYILVAKIISKRIHTIINVMNKTVANNLNYRIPLTNRNNEFEEIAVNFNKMCDNLQDHINRIYIYELQQKTAKIKLLENQINPHFLYNSLEAIRASLDIDDNEEGARMIQSLATIFRDSLKSGSIVKIGEELEYCKRYIEMYTIRYKRIFQVSFDIQDNVLEFGTIKLILQPILENYFIHGIDKQRTDNMLCIKMYLEEDCIYMIVTDNGVGIDNEALSYLKDGIINASHMKNRSIGLFNINERIKLFFGAEYGVSIDSKLGNGTEIVLKHPARSIEDIDELK